MPIIQNPEAQMRLHKEAEGQASLPTIQYGGESVLQTHRDHHPQIDSLVPISLNDANHQSSSSIPYGGGSTGKPPLANASHMNSISGTDQIAKRQSRHARKTHVNGNPSGFGPMIHKEIQ
jgi:hypothetical protein